MKTKNIFALVIVTLLGTFLITSPSYADDDYESVTFTLTNNTSRDLLEFYASPPSTDDWEEDILGTDVLEPGDSVEITIDDGREDCLYDFKGVLGPSDDGSVGEGALIQTSVEVCDGGTYVYSD